MSNSLNRIKVNPLLNDVLIDFITNSINTVRGSVNMDYI